MVGSYNNHYYAGVARQRGSGIGSLALGIGTAALPYVVPLAKKAVSLGAKVGKQFAADIAPELLDSLVSRRKPRGSEIRRVAAQSIRKQIGRGKKKRKRKVSKRNVSSKRRRVIRRKSGKRRSRLDFFSNVQNDI